MSTAIDKGLTREEKLILSFLAITGLVIWVIAALTIAGRYRASGGGPDIQPPLLRLGETPTPTALFWSTATPMPTNTLVPEPSPTPLADPPSPTPVPTSVEILPLNPNIEVIAVLGIDEPHGSAIWRTDSIILAFVDRDVQRLSLLSIPRDLWLQIPGYSANRINTIDALGERTRYPGGGRGLLHEALRFNLGVPVHHYVRIDFQGFIDIVDTMGGVDVDVKAPLSDDFPDPTAPTGWAYLELPAGPAHLDGQTALSYCRSRATTDDFDRSTRQQQVLFALAKKALTVDTLARAPQLWTQLDAAVDTDLDLASSLQLAYFVQGLPEGQIRSRQIDPSLIQYWNTPEGAQVLLPRTAEIRQFILDLVNSP